MVFSETFLNRILSIILAIMTESELSLHRFVNLQQYQLMPEKLLGKTPEKIAEIAGRFGMPRYAAGQIADWIYRKKVRSIEDMTNIAAKTRKELLTMYDIGAEPPLKVQVSVDGTKKYLYSAAEGRYIEAAFIPDHERSTLCLSSQVGCRMGCLFCMTGKQGFQGNLSAAEILNQWYSLPERDKVTNIVYMGMGEPLDNLEEVLHSLTVFTSSWGFGMSPRRITVSTIGILPKLHEFLERSEAHLAISLHTPFDEERIQLMPMQKAYPIREVIGELRKYRLNRQRRISFEYILFRGLNDTQAHIKELARLLNGLRCRINLIRFHSIPGVPLESPDEETILRFRNALTDKGIYTTIRASRGQDIAAACGLLSTRELTNRKKA